MLLSDEYLENSPNHPQNGGWGQYSRQELNDAHKKTLERCPKLADAYWYSRDGILKGGPFNTKQLNEMYNIKLHQVHSYKCHANISVRNSCRGQCSNAKIDNRTGEQRASKISSITMIQKETFNDKRYKQTTKKCSLCQADYNKF